MEVQEAQRVPNKMDAKRPIPRHIRIKMPKVKDKEIGWWVWENGWEMRGLRSTDRWL